MNKLSKILLRIVLIIFVINSQWPIANGQTISSQKGLTTAIFTVRNALGNIISNQPISMRFSIHDSSPSGTVVYSETQNKTTNLLGLVNVVIGEGTPVTGTIAGVNWGLNIKFTQVEMDVTGGSNYVDMGTTQIFPVPYATYALNLPEGTANGNTLRWNGTQWVANNTIYNNGTNVGINQTNPSASLEIIGNIKITDGTQGINKVLTSDANGLASWQLLTAIHFIGENYAGGIVFYITQDGIHGLIAETQDQGSFINWYNAQDVISKSINHTIGGQKFTDWRLPTKNELNLMYIQRALIGGFPANVNYWSSTESDGANAWCQSTFNGQQFVSSKLGTGPAQYVRAVRVF